MKMHHHNMMPMHGGFHGRGHFPHHYGRGHFPMRGMMRGSFGRFPFGAGQDYFSSPFEYGPFYWKGHHGHGRKCKGHRRRKGEESKRKSDDKGEEEIVIDDSDESPETDFENTEPEPFEVHVNLRGCDPDKIKIGIKDGLLKIEGSTKSTDVNFISVTHEQTIPENVSGDNLKAFLHPEGLLIVSEMEKDFFPVQLKVEKRQ